MLQFLFFKHQWLFYNTMKLVVIDQEEDIKNWETEKYVSYTANANAPVNVTLQGCQIVINSKF